MKKLLTYILLTIVALCVLAPLAILLSASIMDKYELADYLAPIFVDIGGYATFPLLPQYPTLRAYVELLLDSPEYFVMFWNSVSMTIPAVALQCLVATPAAWAFARYDFRFKKILFTLYLVLMLMPFQVTMVSSYLVLDKLELMDTRWAVILPAVFSTFPVFIMVKFFSSIPVSLIEAAELDGAGQLGVFWHIGLPMGMPGVISAATLGFLECWSAVEQPLTFLQNKSLWPLSLYLPQINISSAAVSLAASVVVLIPALLVFMAGQGYIEQGIKATGLKE